MLTFLCLVIHHPAIFDALIQRDFWIILKIGNLCMPFYDVITIALSTSSFNPKMLGKKEENYKNENISRNTIAFKVK